MNINAENKRIMADNINYYMTLQNKTRRDVCQALKIPYTTFSDWINAVTYPRIDKIELMANYFGVTKSDLVEAHKDRTTKYNVFNESPHITYYSKELPNIIDIGDFQNIELVANIRAGYDGSVLADVSDIISVPSRMLKGYPPSECKAFIVMGNSMWPEYKEGDYLVVHVQSSVDSGDVAVIIYNNNEATVKKVKYVYGEDWLELIPINPEYMVKRIEGIDIQECFVYGKVISMMRL